MDVKVTKLKGERAHALSMFVLANLGDQRGFDYFQEQGIELEPVDPASQVLSHEQIEGMERLAEELPSSP